MDNRNILLEDIGLPVSAIDSIVLQTNDTLSILLGEKVSTKYPISYTEISGNDVAKKILGEIASNVSWNDNLREYNKASAQCRYVFLAASILPPLAKKLYEMSLQYRGPDAKRVREFFEQLYQFHTDVRLATGKRGRLNHEFATMADNFYTALLGAMEICTPTRAQTTVDEDYGASTNVHTLWDYIGIKYKSIRSMVEQMLSGADIAYDPENPYISYAAEWLLAYLICKKQLFGAEFNDTSEYMWRDVSASLTEQLYDIIRYAWKNTKAVKAAKAENSDNFVDLSDETNVIKDMAHLGDNTSQLNIVNDLTKFTCQQYYKVFAVDGLRPHDFNTAVGRLVYKIMAKMMADIGHPFRTIVNSPDSASQFADYIRDFFAKAAANTKTAAIIHRDLLDAYSVYAELVNIKDFEKFAELYVNKYRLGNVTESTFDDTVTHLSDALKAITSTIVFGGKNSVHGSTVNNDRISFTDMPTEVATFGIYSTNDRKQTMDLSTAGTITAKCFHYANNTLTISFNGSNEDGSPGNVMVDTIPLEDIKSISDHYISSRLLPAHISNAYAWIVLCGLTAFSPVNGGDLEDSVAQSDVTRSYMADVSDANVYKNTRISGDAKRKNCLARPDLSKWMAECDFINAGSKSNMAAKLQVSGMVTSICDDTYIKNKVIATKKLCQNFSSAVWSYARTCASKDVVSASSIVSRLYDAAPTIYELVIGKKSAIDNMLLTYVSSNSEEIDDDASLYNTLCLLSSTYDDLKSSRVDKGFYSLLAKMNAMLSVVNNAIKSLPEQFGTEVDSAFGAIGKPYAEMQQIVSTLYKECIESGKPSAYAMQHSAEIVDGRNIIVNALNEQYQTWQVSIDDRIASTVGADEDLNQLKTSLYKIVNDFTTGNDTTEVTSTDLLKLNNIIAQLMLGDMTSNKEVIKKLTVPQYGLRVRVLGTLMYTAGLAESPDKIDADDEATNAEVAAGDDEVFELPEGGGESMPEVSWMSPENAGGALYHTITADGDADVNKAMSFDNIPFSDTYLKEMTTLCRQLQETESKRDSLAKKVNAIRTIAMNLPGASSIPPGDNSIKSALDVYLNDDSINQSMKITASRYVKQLKDTDKEYDEINTAIRNFQREYPSYTGLMLAIVNHEISFDELNYALGQLSNAKEQLATLVKYRSYSDADNDSGRREFAYTESDFSTIAQIIDVLGTYLITPQDSNDNVYDLLDVLNNMSTAIDRYSGNKLSRSIIKKSIHMVKSAIDEAKQSAANSSDGHAVTPDYSIVAVTIVKLINQLGKMLVTRESELADTNELSQLGHISRPSGTGAAIDSFARSQLRELPADKTERAKIKMLGATDSAEKAARQSYVDLLKRDMAKNPELSRYAYMLGTAFNAFGRVMKDERVGGKNNRAFNDIMKGFSELGLFGNMCDNDLQREVISAIIDDERGNDTSYKTVEAVVNAAKSGGSFNSYSQMYSKTVGSTQNILNDQKNALVAFDENGNRTTPDKAVSLDNNTISELVVGKEDGYVVPFSSISDLVHMVRMSVFRKIADEYGSMDVFTGEFKYKDAKAKTATKLMTTALKSLYRLCDDMETPIADIIFASSMAGQKSARYSIMSYVNDKLGNDDDIDLNLVGMVSDEPDVFPEMMSNEWSQVDNEWVNGISELFSKIPDSIDPNTLHNVVVEYMNNQASRERLALNADYRVVCAVIENMFRLDTATGIPTGFWGNDSTDRRNTIIALFDELIRKRDEENDTWAKAADAVADDLMASLRKGQVNLGVGSKVFPTQATKRRLGHLRMNPYYAVDLRQDYVDEYKKLVDKLTSMNVIAKNGSAIKLKYPGMSLDRNTFGYIVKMALSWEDAIDADIVERFFIALMCYVTGIRIAKYLSMEMKADAQKSNIDYDALNQASDEIKQAYSVVDYGEMVKTSLGWFTGNAYRVLCIIAMRSKDGAVKGFASAVNSLTDGGVRSLDIKEALKPRKVKKPAKKKDMSGGKPTTVPVVTGTPDAKPAPKAKKPKMDSKTVLPTPEPSPAPVSEPQDVPEEEDDLQII